MGRTWKNCGDELMEILELTSVATLLLFCFVGGGRVVVCAVCISVLLSYLSVKQITYIFIFSPP